MIKVKMKNKMKGGYSLESLSDEYYIRKIPMKEKFGYNRIKKDGNLAKIATIPDVLVNSVFYS